MYGQMPYMFPGTLMQSAAPAASGLANAGRLGSALGAAKTGASSLLTKVNWSSLLSNAQKTLNVVNQAIPLYYQVKPVFNNIKTLGRIGKEFTKLGSSNDSITKPLNKNNNTSTNKETTKETAEVENTSETIPEPKFFL